MGTAFWGCGARKEESQRSPEHWTPSRQHRPLPSCLLSALRSPRPVSPRYFGRRAPRPVTSPLVRSLPGCCDREMSWRPRPASSPSSLAHPAGVQVPGSHPVPSEGSPTRPPGLSLPVPARERLGILTWEPDQVLTIELVPHGSSSLGRCGQ